MTAGKWMVAAILVLAGVPQLAAAEYWRYETDSGSTAFTDDVKNVPAKYRASAVKIAEESLFTYRKLSVVEPAPAPRAATAAEQPVPAFIWPVEGAPAAAAVTRAPAPRMTVDVEGVRIEVDSDDYEPLRIEKRQYTGEGDSSGVIAPQTVVRRGNKVLAYIDER